MNANEQEIFDGLMRQKLGGYSERPDMELLEGVHRKKNRIMKIYGIYRLLMITGITALGLLGSYYSFNALRTGHENAGLSSPDRSQQSYQAPVGSRIKDNTSNAASFTGNYVAFTAAASSPSVYSSHASETVTAKNPPARSHSQAQANRVPASAPVSGKNTLPAKLPSLLPVPQPPSQIKEEGKKTENEKGKDDRATSSCKATFDYYVSYDGRLHFTNFSEVPDVASYLWTFGDGNSSSAKAPEHLYSSNGTYLVSLRASSEGCSDALQKTIVIGKPAVKKTAYLKGTVFTGGRPLSGARLKLIHLIDAGHSEITASFTASTSGQFVVIAPPGSYTLLAEGVDNRYRPTYLGNTTESENAQDIVVLDTDEEMPGYDIVLRDELPDVSLPVHGAANTYADSGATLVLMDANNNPVGTVSTDKYGNYKVSENVPPGDYKLVDKNTGQVSSASVVPGAGLILSGSSGGTPVGGGAAGIATPSPESITFTPNPALNSCNFSVDMSTDETFDIRIVNSSGVVIYSATQSGARGANHVNVNIVNLPDGKYYVVVHTANGKVITGQLIKESNQRSGQ